MNSAEIHDLEASLGMAEAKRAVWADDNWDGGIEHCLDRITPHLLGRTRVIDYGCGMGRLMKPLLEYRDDLYVTGFDPSVAMLNRSREYFGVQTDTWWSSVRLTAELPDERFDVAYCILVLQHLRWPERQRVLENLARLAQIVVVQFVRWTPGAEDGPMSHPLACDAVLEPLATPQLVEAHYSVDSKFPTWGWLVMRYAR